MNKQDRLIEQLIQLNIFKLPDGRDLFEGNYEELERLLEEDRNHRYNGEMVNFPSRTGHKKGTPVQEFP